MEFRYLSSICLYSGSKVASIQRSIDSSPADGFIKMVIVAKLPVFVIPYSESGSQILVDIILPPSIYTPLQSIFRPPKQKSHRKTGHLKPQREYCYGWEQLESHAAENSQD